MGIAYLGLGSNLGNREENLITALSLIKNCCKILDISSIFETSPVGYREQPDFLNMVVKVDTDQLSVHALLDTVKDIEKATGRKQTFHWGPRIIDIDILYIQDITVESSNLTIPHRELLNREFVLIPLSELTEYLKIQGKNISLKQRITELVSKRGGQGAADARCDSSNRVVRYKSKEDITGR